MKCLVLKEIQLKTSKGEVELRVGQTASLPQTTAIELINKARIAPMGRMAYKVYSDILEAYIWIVADEGDIKTLCQTEKTTDIIYTVSEIKNLKGKPPRHIKAVHDVKREFPGSQVVETDNDPIHTATKGNAF